MSILQAGILGLWVGMCVCVYLPLRVYFLTTTFPNIDTYRIVGKLYAYELIVGR